MNPQRRQALIEAHRTLRKEAFEAVAPAVATYFQDARTALTSVKHASETTAFDAALRRHLVEP